MRYLILDGGVLGSGLFRNEAPELVDVDDGGEERVLLQVESSHTELAVETYYKIVMHIRFRNMDFE